jgi:hypothetical protein
MDLEDERVQKQNQNAIENYKLYIESVKHLRDKKLDNCSIKVAKNLEESKELPAI